MIDICEPETRLLVVVWMMQRVDPRSPRSQSGAKGRGTTLGMKPSIVYPAKNQFRTLKETLQGFFALLIILPTHLPLFATCTRLKELRRGISSLKGKEGETRLGLHSNLYLINFAYSEVRTHKSGWKILLDTYTLFMDQFVYMALDRFELDNKKIAHALYAS